MLSVLNAWNERSGHELWIHEIVTWCLKSTCCRWCSGNSPPSVLWLLLVWATLLYPQFYMDEIKWGHLVFQISVPSIIVSSVPSSQTPSAMFHCITTCCNRCNEEERKRLSFMKMWELDWQFINSWLMSNKSSQLIRSNPWMITIPRQVLINMWCQLCQKVKSSFFSRVLHRKI